MHVKRFEAADMAEALRMVKLELGPNAIILSTRQGKKDSGAFGIFGRSSAWARNIMLQFRGLLALEFRQAPGSEWSPRLRKQTESQTHLNRVDARIRPRNAGVGDMHVSHFRAPVIFSAQKMRSQRTTSGEIHV